MEHISELTNTANPLPVRSGRMRPTESTPTTTAGKLRRMPPTVKPETTPDEIIREALPSLEDRRVLARHLIQYRKTEAQWDDYRKKLPDSLLKDLAAVNAEMRRNGFYGLGAEVTKGDRLRFTWHQALDNRVKPPIIPGTLCDACERPCARKEKENWINECKRNGIELKGAMAEELTPCWK